MMRKTTLGAVLLAVAALALAGFRLAANDDGSAPPPAPAAVSGPSPVDMRLKAMFDERRILYSIDDLNSFVIKWDNQKTRRSQRCVILSRVDRDTTGKFQVREIVSLAGVSDGMLTADQMDSLLRENMGTQFGGWALNSNNDGKTCLWYVAEIDANASIDAVIVASQIVCNIADAKENQIYGDTDNF